MNAPSPGRSGSQDSKRRRQWRTIAIIVGIAVSYVLLRPSLQVWFGVSLPTLTSLVNQEIDSGAVAEHRADRRRDVSQTDASDRDGPLRKIGRDTWASAAGVIYGRGGREGSRLDHILRHAEDQPDRPGSHGVFDGDRNEIIRLIDEAFLEARRGGRHVDTDVQDRRTVHTVDMQRRVGYIGGQNGPRLNHPAATHVRLVLEGKRIITAYPVRQQSGRR